MIILLDEKKVLELLGVCGYQGSREEEIPLRKEAFRVSKNIAQKKKVERKRKLVNRKRRIQYRLGDINWEPQDQPISTASNIHHEPAGRVREQG